MTSEQMDMFSSLGPVPADPATGQQAKTNDMGVVESVLATAMRDGFALVGTHRRVYRLVGKEEIEKVPRLHEITVHQLIAAKWLEEGGTRYYRCGRHYGPGRSVLVPKTSKQAWHRWRALKRPSGWSSVTTPDAPRALRNAG